MLASPGIGSGLDINGIVTQLMTLERRPLQLLDTRETQQKAQLSAFGNIKSALSTFQETLKTLSDPLKFSATTASFADSSLAVVSTSGNAVPGSYAIEIKSLAQAHKIKSENFASSSDVVGSGTLTIQFGAYNEDGSYTVNPDKPDQTITIDSDQSTLAGVRSAINNANAGVTASIVNDGSGSRLVIASQDGGTSNALRITVSDDDGNATDNAGLSRLAFDASTGGVSNLSQAMAARNASLVVDGILITKSTNTITDAIEGVTLNLQKTNEGSTALLTIERDVDSIKETVKSFVDGYNALDKTINGLTRFDSTNRQGAVLTGDSITRTIQSRMMAIFNTPLTTTSGGLSHLSEIGITFQKDGKLALDANKLDAVLADPGKNIAAFFANQSATTSTISDSVTTSDALISIVNPPAAFQAGNYAVNITQLATQGNATASKVAGLSITSLIGFANNTLNVTIDGVSASITLANGSYNADSLAAEIQSKINSKAAFSAAGISTTVSQNAGVLSVTSSSYGASSNVLITGGNGKDDIFGSPTQTAGQNVAGTIGGLAATGSGKTLNASGALSGLVLNVNGGSTGARGTVDLTQTTETIGSDPNSIGLAGRLNTFIDGLLRSDGLIDGRMDGINTSIRDIGRQRDAVDRRLEDVERRFRTQFSALDTLLASMSQTSNFLQQQLASLPGSGR
ncbi:flagellar filament capping protein FliD [Nitrosomonas mobilis]|uniref:Flagellar hook-associated protein 2 n=1 Tax=Nitrosomonas mobilis TaxID=51642 RepID=A0A1G5SBY8_9PROT|nr:flagellar filament capping protein FliD [Nitrosomonas mobilis]SCZ84320.1 Flagellar hook-associated 2 domain-containing protein [Nitrosomonas mobilis]